ncbi:very short patch repair endonuclease [Rhizobium leguminosarum]|uniref:very short patch repair endonuclease n=1 Tax=Rhizobium leguminosarum TaxID=384 RepID=UPI001C97F3F6|nr:very short patch repair endonuclease [Rhizobium leguminosarum]MBY5524062.1 DNA mismatch endonuclease Vsr [Rhizobium leguminosarum]
MVDRLDQAQRSALMRSVKAKNTKPEMIVRSTAHQLGYRFRLHVKDLAGKPDLVFPARKKIIFVHGCFWHRHKNCHRASTPVTNVEFWNAKFQRNSARDIQKEILLRADGWEVLTIWECEVRNIEHLAANLVNFIGGTGQEDSVEGVARIAPRGHGG